MKKKAKKQSNKLMSYFISTPIMILKKARQLYMKSVEDCAGGLGYDGSAIQISRYPKTKSFNEGDELERELLRREPTRNCETRVVINRERERLVGYNNNGIIGRSSNIGLRKMGMIDEDKPCYFEEDQIDMKAHLLYLYPRSRSYVVNKQVVS